VLGGVLIGEAALVAACFDALPLLDASHAWWARLIAQAGPVVPLMTAVATATLLLGGTRLRADLEATAALTPRARTWPFVLAHLVAFILFFRLTGAVFDTTSGGTLSGWWAALWMLAGAVVVATLTGAALPRRALVPFVRRGALVLLACAAVGTVAWEAGRITGEWWYPLGRSTLWMVVWLLRRFTDEPIVVPEEFIVGTRAFQVEIESKCSGYEGIGLVSVFLVVYLWTFRRDLRFPRALLLFPIGMAAMWFANAVRIAALVGVGTVVSPEIAVGGFHANSGSLLLCGVALGIGWAARRSPWFTVAALPVARSAGNPTAAYLAPLVAIVATSMVTGSFTGRGFDALYALRVITAGAALWAGRRHYRDLAWTWSWGAVGIGIAAFVLWLALEPAATPGAPDAIGGALAAMPAAAAGAWLVARIVGAVVTVPLAEELAFRGYLLRRLVDRDFQAVPPRRFTWLAFLGSSLLFGALHDRFLAGTLAGMLYAGALHRRGAIGDAITAHATTNALLAAWVLATRSWSLW